MQSIIYIDDEANTEKMKSKFELLKGAGFQIIPVTSLEDAIPTIDKFYSSIDLVILDIIMPPGEYYTLEESNGGTSSGFALLEDIRKSYPDIPIMIVSIKRTDDVKELLISHNVKVYVEKPVSTAELVSYIKRAIPLQEV